MKIRKNDMVIVISGADKGKTGKVLQVIPERDRVIVEGINFVKRHTKARGQGEQGGILEKEGTLHISNVQLLYNDEPTKIGYQTLADGKKVRVARRTGDTIA
ncbi:MAG: 50S ribosomal protein L24 [Gemmatimonadetes bacterium]|nr:50S ribosomal protein L24 [Gemmatimonadota bacterium]